jgi:predicted component of type VI protein secretion system
MYLLRLFHESEPAQPVAAHMLREGTTRIGRDPTAEWAIADPDCQISRHHIELEYHDGAIVLRPLGANGVFLGDGKRLPDGEPLPIALGDAVSFGKYRMVVDSVPFATRSGASFERTMVFAAPDAQDIPTDWSDTEALPPGPDEGSLLEAFCEGAKLDVSALSGQEQAEIMHRAGAIYRQMVLGLANLVGERSAAKAALHMDRTTIAAQDNNPLKWAPTRRLATDLLLGEESGFLTGPGAIRASFDEVKTHMAGIVSGFEATLRAVVDQLDPEAVAGRVDGQSAFLKGRAALCWAEYEKVHGDVRRRIAEQGDGALRDAFVAAYDKATDAADRLNPPPDRLDAAE